MMTIYNKNDLKQLANVELCNDTKRYDELSGAEFERLFVTFHGV